MRNSWLACILDGALSSNAVIYWRYIKVLVPFNARRQNMDEALVRYVKLLQ